jgi:predicted dehydrogenase
VKVGIVGLNFGIQHLRTAVNLDGHQVVGVADSDAGRRESAARQYGVATFTDAVELMETAKPDALILATSPARRGLVLARAGQLGIPVFVEKPWAATVAQGREFIKICDENLTRVMLGFSFRYHAPIRKLIELAGGWGRPLVVRGAYLNNWLPPAEAWLWRPEVGGGYLNENSGHLFDIVNAVLGTPKTVQAVGIQANGRPSAEAAHVLIEYDSGAIATLTLGGIGVDAFQDYPSLEFIAEGGQAKLGGRGHIWESIHFAPRGSWTLQHENPAPECLADTRYTRALTAFFTEIEAGQTTFSSRIADGQICVAIAEAAYRALQSGQKEPVQP